MKHLALVALLALPVYATDKPPAVVPHEQHQTQGQQQAQDQDQAQQQSAEQSQVQESHQANSQTIESERQAPSTFSSTPSATAPCRYSNGGSLGLPGAGGGWSKSRRDEDCWAEYLRQAEHERAKDAALLALEREKLVIERDRLSFQREQAQTRQQCSDIATRSLESCNAGEK